jgi:hypothetical protein
MLGAKLHTTSMSKLRLTLLDQFLAEDAQGKR